MADPIFSYDRLARGEFATRPNRFKIRVNFGNRTEDVYLRNSGGLGTVLGPGREVLCRPVDDSERKTSYDAIAVKVGDMWVTVDSVLPNKIFETCVTRNLLPRFTGYEIQVAEPELPDGGRADFLLTNPDGEDTYIEVKSNTYVADGVSKFPDRPTKRGRRHLRSLIGLVERGIESHVVFVVQRPDATCVIPFREVDPTFAELLEKAVNVGVGVRGLSTSFHPPNVHLFVDDLPVNISLPST